MKWWEEGWGGGAKLVPSSVWTETYTTKKVNVKQSAKLPMRKPQISQCNES
jgi:hypothetical protein